MAGQELGRPSYRAGAPVVRSAQPPDFQAPAGSGRRRGAPPARSASGLQLDAAPVERGRQAKQKKPKDQEPTAAAPTVYVPVVAGQGVGYGLWRFARFIILMVLWLLLTMVKVALSPFTHITGGNAPHLD